MKKKRMLAIHILCSMTAGALIYVMASPEVIWVKKAAELWGGAIPAPVFPADHVFFRLVRNYLPDMLWAHSLVCALFFILGNRAADAGRILWLSLPFSAAVEILQMTSLVPGTFDVFDLIAEALTEIAAAWIIYKIYMREDFNYEEKQKMDCRSAVFDRICGNGSGKR